MSVQATKRGFTLIEVLSAGAAFVIAFLAGSAVFAKLLQQQTVNYNRTLADSMAMILVKNHVEAGTANFETTALSPIFDQVASSISNVKFSTPDYVASTDHVYVLKANASLPASLAGQLDGYRSIVVTVSPESSPAENETDFTLTWRQLTFWHGSAQGVRDNQPLRLEFLCRFLVPDTCP